MGKGVVYITGDLFRICSPRPGQLFECVSNDIPEDAEFLGCSYDAYNDRFVVCVQSPSLPQSPDGYPLPDLMGPSFVMHDVETEIEELED